MLGMCCFRNCFLEIGKDCGHLQGAEYSVLCKYYELLESKLDIGIDLIGECDVWFIVVQSYVTVFDTIVLL